MEKKTHPNNFKGDTAVSTTSFEWQDFTGTVIHIDQGLAVCRDGANRFVFLLWSKKTRTSPLLWGFITDSNS